MIVNKVCGVLVVVVSVVVVCVNSQDQLVTDSPKLSGQRCCWDSQTCLTTNDDINKNNTTNNNTFSPLVYLRQLGPVPADEVVNWTLLTHIMSCPPGYRIQHFTLNDTSTNRLLGGGDVLRLAWHEIYFRTTTEFCVGQKEGAPTRQFYVAVCRPQPEELCDSSPCVSKCCGVGEDLHLKKGICLAAAEDHFNITYHTIGGEPTQPSIKPLVVDKLPSCEPIVPLEPHLYDKDLFHLLPNGKLYVVALGAKYDHDKYCLEYNAEEEAIIALVCHEDRSAALKVKDKLQTVGVAISSIFLAITIILHLATPKLRDMQGRCLLSHMSALLVAELALFTSYVSSDNLSPNHCLVNGMIVQYAFLSAFFWLNVMCFDIWRVIRSTVKLIPLTGILEKDKKKFIIYSTYSWGGPAIVTIITIILHHVPPPPGVSSLVKPDIGKSTCFFYDDYPLLAYFYGLVAFLFVINIVLLGHTIGLLYHAGSAFSCFTRQVSGTSFNRHHLQAFWQRFSIFAVMALCWTSEILSWKIPPPELWIFTDVLNSLQGFMIFVIFISSRKKRNLLQETWGSTMARVTNAARKMSSPDNSGVTWHVNTSSSTVSMPKDSHQSQASKESQVSKDSKDEP